jgi:hypothetical protein
VSTSTVGKNVSLVDEDDDDEPAEIGERREKGKRQKKKKKKKRNRPEEWARQAAAEEERLRRENETAEHEDVKVEIEYIQVGQPRLDLQKNSFNGKFKRLSFHHFQILNMLFLFLSVKK